jgi:pantoate--beta-alanine ligase
MHVFTTNKDLIHFLENERIKRKKIGFVPTMGALHMGHMALIKNALKDTDICVCSIFVNPTQFNNEEDLKKYPRTVEEDLAQLEKEGCQVVYLPDVQELYDDPSRIRTTIHFGEIENILEGRYRPGHLQGVGIIVVKLFNIVRPDHAYFGQKDLQQFQLVRQLIHDLSYAVCLHAVPTQREEDGLAMSSRNRRINAENRKVACKLYECLLEGSRLLKNGFDPQNLQSFADDFISRYDALRLEYIALVDMGNFRILNRMEDAGRKALCIAGYVGNIRIIDNVLLN